jgi:hypothetical protein
MEMREILADLQENPTVPIWPHYAKIMRISRGTAFEAVKNGDVEVLRVGRLIRVISAPLRRQLGLDGKAA